MLFNVIHTTLMIGPGRNWCPALLFLILHFADGTTVKACQFFLATSTTPLTNVFSLFLKKLGAVTCEVFTRLAIIYKISVSLTFLPFFVLSGKSYTFPIFELDAYYYVIQYVLLTSCSHVSILTPSTFPMCFVLKIGNYWQNVHLLLLLKIFFNTSTSKVSCILVNPLL